MRFSSLSLFLAGAHWAYKRQTQHPNFISHCLPTDHKQQGNISSFKEGQRALPLLKNKILLILTSYCKIYIFFFIDKCVNKFVSQLHRQKTWLFRLIYRTMINTYLAVQFILVVPEVM